jgi:TRAP-type mannitol/chloroaromatic compound transport system permease small subunit
MGKVIGRGREGTGDAVESRSLRGMRRGWLAFFLFAAGVALIIVAICWSLYAYGQVAQMVGSREIRPASSFRCLLAFGGRCDLLATAHAKNGTLAYTPLVFWAGLAAVIASFVVNLLPRVENEPWGVRLQRLLLPVDRVSTIVGQFFAWSIVLLTLAVSYEVFSRYVLGSPTDWAFDASYILYGTLFIMAGAYALSRNAHVRGDFLYRAWRPRTQAWMDLVLYFLFFFPGIIAFIYSGYGFAAQSWFSHEHSAYSPSGPPIYHYKTIIPVTGVFLLLQGIVEVVRCLVCIKTGDWPQRLHDVEELEKIILEQHADGTTT